MQPVNLSYAEKHRITFALEPAVNYAQAIYQRSLQLPETAAREALDFIDFLAQRYARPTVPGTTDRDTERFLNSIAAGWAGDFPDDITDTDLGAEAPRDTL
jgi:hypothetical protein